MAAGAEKPVLRSPQAGWPAPGVGGDGRPQLQPVHRQSAGGTGASRAAVPGLQPVRGGCAGGDRGPGGGGGHAGALPAPQLPDGIPDRDGCVGAGGHLAVPAVQLLGAAGRRAVPTQCRAKDDAATAAVCRRRQEGLTEEERCRRAANFFSFKQNGRFFTFPHCKYNKNKKKSKNISVFWSE